MSTTAVALTQKKSVRFADEVPSIEFTKSSEPAKMMYSFIISC